MKVIFLDKDGTLVEDAPYNVDTRMIRLTWGAADGLRRLADAGYQFIIVSNQSGVARGFFPEERLMQVRKHLEELLAAEGIALLDFFYCPHHPDGSVPEYAIECSCRKPKPGLLQQALERYEINLGHSWIVGDILDDIEAGKRLGVRSALLDNGHETEWVWSLLRNPDIIAKDLGEAAETILFCEQIEIAGKRNVDFQR